MTSYATAKCKTSFELMAGGPERTVKAALVGEEANHPQLDAITISPDRLQLWSFSTPTKDKRRGKRSRNSSDSSSFDSRTGL